MWTTTTSSILVQQLVGDEIVATVFLVTRSVHHRQTRQLPDRTKFRRTKVPKIWLAAENFVRKKILSAKNFIRRQLKLKIIP